MAKKGTEKEFLMYRDKPMVRCGNIIYYGNPTDKYIIMMQIMESKKVNDIDVATKVMVHLQHADQSVKASVRNIKSSEKSGIYEAMDVGEIWLQRAIKEGK